MYMPSLQPLHLFSQDDQKNHIIFLVLITFFADKTRQRFTNFASLQISHEDPPCHIPLMNCSPCRAGKSWIVFTRFACATALQSTQDWVSVKTSICRNLPFYLILADGVRTAHSHAVKALIFPQLASFLWSKWLELSGFWERRPKSGFNS